MRTCLVGAKLTVFAFVIDVLAFLTARLMLLLMLYDMLHADCFQSSRCQGSCCCWSMLMHCLLVLSCFALSVVSFSAGMMLLSKNALSCCARSCSVCLTCFWVGCLLLRHLGASCKRLVVGFSGGLGVASVNVAKAAYLLGDELSILEGSSTLLVLILLVFFPCTSIHCSLSEPAPCHS